MQLLKGNTYNLKIQLKDDEGNVVDNTLVSEIQFIFGSVEKSYPTNVTYDDVSESYVLSLTQAETFSLLNTISYQVRVKFTDDSVKGSIPTRASVIDSLTEEIL